MRLLHVFCLCTIMMLSGSSGYPLNELKAVSYSDSSQQKDKQALELGSITLFFAEKPLIVTYSKLHAGHDRYIELFCPQSSLDTNKIQQDISFSEKVSCNLKIECVKAPVEGIKLVINYDPQKVHVSHDEFIDSGSSVGLVVRLYDQRILSKLHSHTTPLLQLA